MISNIIDAKLGMNIDSDDYDMPSFNFNSMVFNHSSKRMSDRNTNFVFTGDTLAAVYDGNYYNFKLDQRTKESEDSYIEGKI